jgi:hypothetical protein
MRHALFVCVLAAAAAVATLMGLARSAAAQPTPVIPSLSQDQVARLEAGEILVEIVGRERPVADALALIEAPAVRVLEVIEDFDHYTEFMPDFEEASIVERDGDVTICRMVIDTPWPMENRRLTVRSRSGPLQLDGVDVLFSDWDYIEGSGNMVDAEGYWLLVPWGDDGQRTLVRYYLVNDLGTWIPDFLLNWANENLVPQSIVAVRQRLVATAP